MQHVLAHDLDVVLVCVPKMDHHVAEWRRDRDKVLNLFLAQFLASIDRDGGDQLQDEFVLKTD